MNKFISLYENFDQLKSKIYQYFIKYQNDIRGIKPSYTFIEDINGISFIIKKSKNYSADFHIGKSDCSELLDAFKYGEFFTDFDKHIYPEILNTFNYELSLKNKKYKSIFDIEKEVINYLDRNNIEYKIIQANTGTKYIDTNKGKIRISDHTGTYRQYENIILYLFPQKYDIREIEEMLDGIFNI